MNKTKILIVDDYPENIEALENLIASPDLEIYTASNANDALELVNRNEFGLALLDVQMPITSGFELAKIIRSVRKYRSLPIIFITAQQSTTSFNFEGYQSGAVDLLFKPLVPEIVRAKVRIFVELAQQRDLLRRHVRDLERLRLEAEAANLAKSQFLANMSHEIRTPLAAVMGFSDLMSREALPDDERATMNAAVQRNGKLLLRLVDDVLDLSKIEANRLQLEEAEVDLAEIIRDIGSTLSFRAEEKGLELELPKGEGSYLSDGLRIKQVLLNVIGNAIKFTSHGSVRVSLEVQKNYTKSNAGSDRLVFRVVDEGVGLTEDQASRLFQVFSQADPSTRRSFGGSGLGLVIARQIARALGGDVKLVNSVHKQGSTFEVSFLLKRSVKAEPDRKAPSSDDKANHNLQGLKILAVHDSPDNLTLLSLYLRGSGAEVHLAENGLKAIREVRSKPIDVVVLDLQMPGMDGHETAEEIRRLGFDRPVIALTAHALNSVHEKCLRSGFTQVLTKPISRVDLLNSLAAYAPSAKS